MPTYLRGWYIPVCYALSMMLLAFALHGCCDSQSGGPVTPPLAANLKPLPPGTIVPFDKMGNGGWFFTDGYVRAIYNNHGAWDVVMQTAPDAAGMTTVQSIAFRQIGVPLFWTGEYIRLEYGGRTKDVGPEFSDYKVHRLSVPVKREANADAVPSQCVHASQPGGQVSRLPRHRRHRKRSHRNPNSTVGNTYGSGPD